MPLRPTSRTQLDGYRFLRRRARYAVVSGDVRMLHDPLGRHTVALVVGAVFGVLAVAACAVLALLKPAPDVSRAEIMVGSDSGALYVRVGETVHPVLNLASARLVLGHPAVVTTVRESDLARTTRGPLVGIPGAPSALPAAASPEQASAVAWTVCDESEGPSRRSGAGRTVVAAGAPSDGGGAVRRLGEDDVVLATHAGKGWLLRDGTRTRIDTGDQQLLEIFHLDDIVPRPVSSALLEAMIEVAPLARPSIPGVGTPVSYGLPGVRVGQIVSVATSSGEMTYVALADGLQQVGPAVADLVRATVTVGDLTRLTPDAVAVPRSTALDTAPFPPHRPRVVDSGSAPVLCSRWASDVTGTGVHTEFHAGTRIPVDRRPVATARADEDGPEVDGVSLPGGGLLVTGVGSGAGAWPRGGVRTVLADTGVRSDVADVEAAKALGLTGSPTPVPGGLLDSLPAGPVLDRPSALVQHDGMRMDPRPGPERLVTGDAAGGAPPG